MQSTTSERTIDKLRSVFTYTGIPEELVSDNGPQFTSSEFKEFLRMNGIKHHLTPPYHPASNGLAERCVKIVKTALKAQLFEACHTNKTKTLTHRLADFLIKYRSTPHTITGVAPCELFMKRQLRTRLSLVKPNLGKHVESKQEKMKEVKDHGTRSRTFGKGDPVSIKTHVAVNKWKWVPGYIHQILGPLTYLVKVLGNQKIRYCHIDHIIARTSTLPTEEPESLDITSPNVQEKKLLPSTNVGTESNSQQVPEPPSTGIDTPTVTQEPIKQPQPAKPTTMPIRRYPQRRNRKAPDRLDL